MRLDPINGIRDGLKINLDDLNSFISNTTTNVNTIAAKRNNVIDKLTVSGNTVSTLPRAMGESIGVILLNKENDEMLHLPLARFVSGTDGVFINHAIFPAINAFYIVNSYKTAKITAGIGTDNIATSTLGQLDRTSDNAFSVFYSVVANDYFDTLLVTFANDSEVKVTIAYDDVVDTAYAVNAFMYKFPYNVKVASFTFDAPKLNDKYTASVQQIIAGKTNINNSFYIQTSPYTALIPNAKYKVDLVCTAGKSSSIDVSTINGSTLTNILSIANGVKNSSMVSNYRQSYESAVALSGGAATATASFDVDESSTHVLLGSNDAPYLTKFSYDENGYMVSYVHVEGSVQIPPDLNATFYDVDGKKVYSTLTSGIYKIVYLSDAQSTVYSLFDETYASMADINSVVINGNSIDIAVDTSGSSVKIADMLDTSYIPSGIKSTDTSKTTLNGSGIELFGCDVFESTNYTFNGTMMDIVLPVTALADTNTNLTALIKTGEQFVEVDDGQFLYAEDVSSVKYVLCRIDTSKHQELANISGATVYAIAATKYKSQTNINASASFKDDNLVYGMILRGDTNTNVSVFVDNKSVYSGKMKEYIELGTVSLSKVSIIANASLGVSFVSPADIKTDIIYVPALQQFTSVSTSASTYVFELDDTNNSPIVTYTQADTVNLDTSTHSTFTVSTSDIDAAKDAELVFTYANTDSYVHTKEFIGYDEETFKISASFDNVGFVPSATYVTIISVR